MDPTNNAPTVNPTPAAMPNPQPVAPVIQPTNPAAAAAAMNPQPVMVQPTGALIVEPTVGAPDFGGGLGTLGATDPLTVPDRPAEPDPIEEELKAPLKPADPAPGSIGSAVSGPAQTEIQMAPAAPVMTAGTPAPQSVAFNDPAAEVAAGAPVAKPKAKTNKTTWILLGVVGGLVVIALVAVLVMVANGMI